MDKKLTFKSLSKATQQELERITKGLINTYNTSPLRKVNSAQAITAEREDIRARCDDYQDGFDEVRTRRQIPDSVPDEQLHDQIVYLPNGEIWLASIYRNHIDQTIIEIIGESQTEYADLKIYLPEILAFFTWCQPELLSVWSKPNSQHFDSLLSLSGAHLEDCFWGAEIDHMPLAAADDVTLRPLDMETDWHWYKTEYDLFHKETPELKERIEIEDKETFEEALKSQLLFVAETHNQPAKKIGVIMLEPCSELGYSGVLVSDFIIAKAFRGKGFAFKIQAATLNKLKRKYDFFCGYIYGGNDASKQNAKKNRHLLRTEITLPIEHFISV
ncbi:MULTISPECIES: hypothetical protein [Pseudoalteromonas]|uniref:N-acetyltransferase domain-containing protein n=1 Tax=Pseudoalteromonas luteoviolacea (strain 2ta16) TaxID=1353533 RepID=V4HIJ5_PSEL2|nr:MULTISPECIES: hypothetical protein [Pseudoalteromonas]ESP90625.1 hypothetical protein PL2TA16_01729 [Pseudoalteromonas luteoviolacea 2ta16]KZN41801.1 hypothetical protein N483_14110 [Pseudoalteromonas luteoviolacea NCIMB 1944]MCG7551312.1 hypothetical protein [Pseudoalteromonas sp. Of7M-16]